MVNISGTPFILYLPEVALEKIFSFLTYDEISRNRIVSTIYLLNLYIIFNIFLLFPNYPLSRK